MLTVVCVSSTAYAAIWQAWKSTDSDGEKGKGESRNGNSEDCELGNGKSGPSHVKLKYDAVRVCRLLSVFQWEPRDSSEVLQAVCWTSLPSKVPRTLTQHHTGHERWICALTKVRNEQIKLCQQKFWNDSKKGRDGGLFLVAGHTYSDTVEAVRWCHWITHSWCFNSYSREAAHVRVGWLIPGKSLYNSYLHNLLLSVLCLVSCVAVFTIKYHHWRRMQRKQRRGERCREVAVAEGEKWVEHSCKQPPRRSGVSEVGVYVRVVTLRVWRWAADCTSSDLSVGSF